MNGATVISSAHLILIFGRKERRKNSTKERKHVRKKARTKERKKQTNKQRQQDRKTETERKKNNEIVKTMKK